MNNVFVSKNRTSQNAALGLALSPPSTALEKGGLWGSLFTSMGTCLDIISQPCISLPCLSESYSGQLVL